MEFYYDDKSYCIIQSVLRSGTLYSGMGHCCIHYGRGHCGLNCGRRHCGLNCEWLSFWMWAWSIGRENSSGRYINLSQDPVIQKDDMARSR